MRFKELVESDMTQAQRAVHAEICAGPRGRMGPPTNVLLRCPELANHSQKIGEYVRFGSTLPSRIMEFVIIMAARHWDAHYAWNSHCPLAIKAGLCPEVASELAKGTRPAGMKDDEAAAYDFCTELHNTKQVGDATFEAALKQFGEAGIVDLMGGSAYYTLICMSLKVNKKTLPEGVPLPWPLSK